MGATRSSPGRSREPSRSALADGGDTVSDRRGRRRDRGRRRPATRSGPAPAVTSSPASACCMARPATTCSTAAGPSTAGPASDRLEGVRGDGVRGPRCRLGRVRPDRGVRISLDGVANDGAGRSSPDVLADVEILLGGPQDDVLRGADGPQSLYGAGGRRRTGRRSRRGRPRRGRRRRLAHRRLGAGPTCAATRAPTSSSAGDGEADLAVCGGGRGAVTADIIDTLMADCDASTCRRLRRDGACIDRARRARHVHAPRRRRRLLARLAKSCTVSAVLIARRPDRQAPEAPAPAGSGHRHGDECGEVRVTVKPNASVRRRLKRVKRPRRERDAADDRHRRRRAHARGHEPAAAQPLNDRSPMPMARTAGAPSTPAPAAPRRRATRAAGRVAGDLDPGEAARGAGVARVPRRVAADEERQERLASAPPRRPSRARSSRHDGRCAAACRAAPRPRARRRRDTAHAIRPSLGRAARSRSRPIGDASASARSAIASNSR